MNGEDTVTTIDPRSGQVVGSAPAPVGTHSLAVARGVAYVAGSTELAAYDIASCASGRCTRLWSSSPAATPSLSGALAPELPVNARDGGFIARGVHSKLDELRMMRDESRRLIATLRAFAPHVEARGDHATAHELRARRRDLRRHRHRLPRSTSPTLQRVSAKPRTPSEGSTPNPRAFP